MSNEKPLSPATNQKQTNACELQVEPAGLDDLPDELLLEILARVPTTTSICPAKSAARLRAVSRRWNSIVSSGDYIPRFISLGEENNCPWGNGEVLLFSDFLESGRWVTYMLPSQCDPNVLDQTLPDFSYISDSYVEIATSEDLLLLAVLPRLNLVVCNPFTKKWATLPDPPGQHPKFKIVCEPQGHRYRVVSTDSWQGEREFVFVSETGEWKEFLFSMKGIKSNILPLGGKLYWYSSDRQIVSYDPFEESFSFFPDPDPEETEDMGPRSYTLSAVHGSLRMLKSSFITSFHLNKEVEFHDFISWELDFMQKRWSLIYKSSLRSLSFEPYPVALHPDGCVVYFDTDRGLASHDLSQGSNNICRVLVEDHPENYFIEALLLAKPWRPTSVSYGSSRLMNPVGEDDAMGMSQQWQLAGKKGEAKGDFNRACLHKEARVASTTSSGGSFAQMVNQPPPDTPVSTSNQLFRLGGKPALMVEVGLQILQLLLVGINGVLYHTPQQILGEARVLVLLSDKLGLSLGSMTLLISVMTMLLMLLCITMRLMNVMGGGC